MGFPVRVSFSTYCICFALLCVAPCITTLLNICSPFYNESGEGEEGENQTQIMDQDEDQDEETQQQHQVQNYKYFFCCCFNLKSSTRI